jgi:NADPH2:quinone reductase
MVKALFEALARGVITAGHRHEYPLDDAAQAHADMEARRTSGAVLLIP